MFDRNLADRRNRRGRPRKAGQQKALERLPIIGFDNEIENMLRIRAVTSDELDTFRVGIEKRIRAAFVDRAAFGSVPLSDMKKH